MIGISRCSVWDRSTDTLTNN